MKKVVELVFYWLKCIQFFKYSFSRANARPYEFQEMNLVICVPGVGRPRWRCHGVELIGHFTQIDKVIHVYGGVLASERFNVETLQLSSDHVLNFDGINWTIKFLWNRVDQWEILIG